MTEHLVWPEHTIKIGAQAYTLVGRFEALAALQHAFAQDLTELQPRIRSMRQDEIARLIGTALRASGQQAVDAEIGQVILDEMDIGGTDYLLLKADLMMWLLISSTPKKDREKKRTELQTVRDRLTPSASPGANIADSPLESSAGAPMLSTEAPSGS